MKNKLREEGLKYKIVKQWFNKFSVPDIIGNIDLAIADLKQPEHYYIWAESKRGNKEDIYGSLVQLILTIGKDKTLLEYLPPAYLGAFDEEKIAFVPYYHIQHVFRINNFNWNVTPSNHTTPEFKSLYENLNTTLKDSIIIFSFEKDKIELKNFIEKEFSLSNKTLGYAKIEIDKNNFIRIYQRWRDEVLPTLSITDWPEAKKIGILDADFYLADLMSDDNNITIKEALRVVLETNAYIIDKSIKLYNLPGLESLGQKIIFTDNQEQHTKFWKKYKRPPREEFQQYILDRRDLLVPQDIREIKGSFFTPQQWVNLSQQRIANVLGNEWQEEYYIWDCAAGTGNLLANLTNPSKIFASTIDKADVAIMKDIAKNNGLPILEDNIFQFDFLNDDLAGNKVPQALKNVLKDKKKRDKLVIYINPPYAEAPNIHSKTGTGSSKKGVAILHNTAEKYGDMIGDARRELFTQFLIRIQEEVQPSVIAVFSKLKILQAPKFKKFRDVFKYRLKSLCIVPANTFDNVKGNFPIGFFVWENDTVRQWKNFYINSDAYDKDNHVLPSKIIRCYDGLDLITSWHRKHYDKSNDTETIGWLRTVGSDIQNQKGVFIVSEPSKNDKEQGIATRITQNNLFEYLVYYTVRHTIPATWMNDRDQFIYPLSVNGEELWKKDNIFFTDCFVYALLNTNIKHELNTNNYWLPFYENEVGAQTSFESHFMQEYIAGKISVKQSGLINNPRWWTPCKPMVFSKEAQFALDASKQIWTYYHTKARGQSDYDVNASLYDVKAYFKRDESGKINIKSPDPHFNMLADTLSTALQTLAREIEPMVYKYRFMKTNVDIDTLLVNLFSAWKEKIQSSSSLTECLASAQNDSEYQPIRDFIDTLHTGINVDTDALWGILVQWVLENKSDNNGPDLMRIFNAILSNLDTSIINTVKECYEIWM